MLAKNGCKNLIFKEDPYLLERKNCKKKTASVARIKSNEGSSSVDTGSKKVMIETIDSHSSSEGYTY